MNKNHIQKINIKESLLFLSICRNTLFEMHNNKEFKYFLKNEASDYQIISIIINNNIPEEKYNIKEEYKLWETFQQIINRDFNYNKLFVEIGPIVEYKLSTCVPILEFLMEASDQTSYVKSLYGNMKSAMKNTKTIISKGTQATASTLVNSAESPIGKIAVNASAGVATAVIIFAAAKIYKDFLSKAAQQCKGKPDKVACMKQYKDRALNARIEKIKSGMTQCNKAKNADACKKSLQKQITKLQVKSNKLSNA